MSSLAHRNDSSNVSGTKVYDKKKCSREKSLVLVDLKGSRLSTRCHASSPGVGKFWEIPRLSLSSRKRAC